MLCPEGMLGNEVSCGLRSEHALLGVLTCWHRRWLRDAAVQKLQVRLKISIAFIFILIMPHHHHHHQQQQQQQQQHCRSKLQKPKEDTQRPSPKPCHGKP